MPIFGPTGSGTAGEVKACTSVSNADYTVLTSDEYIEITTGNTDRTVTLLNPTTNTNKIVRVKKIDSGTGIVKLITAGSQNIETTSQNYYLLNRWDEVTLVATGTVYRIMGAYLPQKPMSPTQINLLDPDTAFINESGGVWTAYADAAATSPVDGTGGAPTCSVAVQATNPLFGFTSLEFTKDAANRQGEGMSALFACPRAYFASVLTIEFDYMVTSGTFVAGAGTAASDLTVWVYDVTNATLIPVTPASLMSASTTLPGHFKGTFQTSATGASYRLIVHVGTTSASAYVLRFDNFRLSPVPAVYGCPSTDWVAYTPTGSFVANTTYTGFWRRVGDTLELEIKVAATGTPTTASLTVNLPSGLTIDTTKITDTTAAIAAIESTVNIRDAGTDNFEGTVRYNSTTSLAILKDDGDGTVSAVTQAAPMTWANGDFADIKVSGIPITGWSSNVVMSNDTDTRVVAAKYTSSTNGAIASAGSATLLPNGKSFDTHSAFDSSTGVYTVPVPGKYRVTASVITSATVGATGVDNKWSIEIQQNGSTKAKAADHAETTTGRHYFVVVNDIVDCAVGDLVKAVVTNNLGNSGTPASDSNHTFFLIERLTGPSAIASSEKCIALITGNPASATSGNPIIVPTASYDSHGAYNTTTGRYTCPSAGIYKVYGALVSASSATTLTIYKNASTASLAGNLDSNGEATFSSAVNCLAGDIIDLRPGGTVDATDMTLNFERV